MVMALQKKVRADNKQRPNIILIVIDSLRADRLSCYGYNRNTSPNIDRVADSGLLFENAIASAPWTLPSHASLFTGLYPSEHGATDETLYLNNHIITLAELLNESGFDTVAFATDNGWLSKSTNLMKGFTKFYGPNPNKASKLRMFLNKVKEAWNRDRFITIKNIEIVERYLRKHGQTNKPFFLFLNLMDVHMPYCPVRKFLKLLNLNKVSPAELEYLQKHFREYRTAPETLSSHQLNLLNSLYDASVATVDERLAQFFDILNNEIERENTVLIITSDHGENLGEHGLLNHWLSLYDTLLRVPLIIVYPSRISGPIRISPQVQQHNLFYTILDFIGYRGRKVSQDIIKSKSFLGKLEGNISFPDYTFAEHAYPQMTLQHIRKFNPSFRNVRLECAKQAIRSNDYKYIRYGSGYEELFDLKSDPGEIRNVIVERKEIARVLKDQLDKKRAILERTNTFSQKPADFEPEVKERLRALGYLD